MRSRVGNKVKIARSHTMEEEKLGDGLHILSVGIGFSQNRGILEKREKKRDVRGKEKRYHGL